MGRSENRKRIGLLNWTDQIKGQVRLNRTLINKSAEVHPLDLGSVTLSGAFKLSCMQSKPSVQLNLSH